MLVDRAKRHFLDERQIDPLRARNARDPALRRRCGRAGSRSSA
ncbi:hypothetical protein BURPS406E_H0445 [Burkholderia pseudomallei 406e]|nr:hypothetical protein BURPS406E_H0445 [Burkholderia pseudomallei 406e]EEH25056.1 hypothetical protein BUH_2546 [Burkholderia pseudomallei Pakistan 9]